MRKSGNRGLNIEIDAKIHAAFKTFCRTQKLPMRETATAAVVAWLDELDRSSTPVSSRDIEPEQ